jgi:peptidoglycan/xylan/chitin deacetylase (PgdA/CDA1 family)
VTVDAEEPHHYAGHTGTPAWCPRDPRLPETIHGLLKHLECVGATATFFCVAATARKHPDLIRAIATRHELASHGTDHQLACSQTLSQFCEDVRTSKIIVEDIAGTPVIGYRAPGWSWPRDAAQRARFYEALAGAGYRYDSSVIPAAVIGTPGWPSIPYRAEAGVWEFPLPCFGLPLITKNLDRFAKNGTYRRPRGAWRGGISAPYSGGMFLRCLGTHFTNLVLSYHLKKRGYAMVYMHPRDLSGEDATWVRQLDGRYLNLYERWRMGFRTKGMKAGLFSLLARHCGCSIAEFLNQTETARAPR